MPVVRHQLTIVGGAGTTGTVTINRHPNGFAADGESEIIQPLTLTLGPAGNPTWVAGYFEADLPPESDYADTGYYVANLPADQSHAFQVPNTVGPHWLSDLVTATAPTPGVLPVRLSALRDTTALAAATLGQVPAWDGTQWTPSSSGGGADHGSLTGLADDDHPHYLTQGRGDARYPLLGHTHTAGQVTGLATVATTGAYTDLTGRPTIPDSPDDIGAAATSHTHTTSDVTGLPAALRTAGIDQAAARYGLLTATILPADTASAGEEIRLAQQRLYGYWLPLPAGTTVTGVRLPVVALSTGAGAIYATVYQSDGTQLGASGDVAAALSAGSSTEWRSIPLAAPAACTGAGVWVTLLSTVDTGTALTALFGQGATGNLAPWACNPSWQRTALRTEGVAVPPATYDHAAATAYVDLVLGIY